ncbi:MAG: LON peptidase substrate-binding domain-containing protein [Candidatus Binataceae bacterium]
MAGLPRIIPLFPLPNLVLFPGIKLPLRIFEPRYRDMIAEVAASQGIIGMILLKGEWRDDYHAFPDIFEVGCAGRVQDLVRIPNGEYTLVLDGLSEFRVRREIRERSYRQAEVEWCPVPHAALECDAETLEGLREVLFNYFGTPAQEAWRALVEQRGLRGAELINFLCFHLDVTPLEKQTMLEAFADRADCLIDVLSFKLEERKLGPGGAGGGSDTFQ